MNDYIITLVILFAVIAFLIGFAIGIALEEQNCELEKRWLSSCKYNLTHVVRGCTLQEQQQYSNSNGN